MTQDSRLRSIAASLVRAAEQRRPVSPIRDALQDVAQGNGIAAAAYAVQRLNVDARVAAGERIVGRKIGLTSKAVQQQLGVDSPDFGTLFGSMALGDGDTVPADVLIQPKVEAEIALVLERDLRHERHTIVDIINATAYALAAIEIVDSRIAGWDIRLADTIADNASSGMFALGTRPLPLSSLDLATCRMLMSESGLQDGIKREVSKGIGAACLGNPLNAAIWLADTMVRMGTPLLAGDIILTGALGPMATVKPGSTYRAQVQSLGAVSVTFGA